MPKKIGSLINSPRRGEFLNNILKIINKIDKPTKRYGDYDYIISEEDNIFVLFKDSAVLGFISFIIKDNKFQVVNIENISKSID